MESEGRLCRWCEKSISARARADSVFCSVRCRQASFRFLREREVLRRCRVPLRVAYADPPYPGKAAIYADRPESRGEVDFLELLERLRVEFPDG